MIQTINLNIYYGKTEFVTRVQYMAHNKIKNIPDEALVRHKCLFKCCVSIDCLETGNYHENAQDKVRDGTQPIGENHLYSKITNEIAMKIKQTKGICTVYERSLFFGITKGIIANIDQGNTWKHVQVDVEDLVLINDLRNFVAKQKKIN